MNAGRQSEQIERPISVLHVVIALETGGLEKFVLDLQRSTGSNYRHTVLCLERPGELASAVGAAEVVCLDLPPGLRLSSLPRLCSLIDARQIDVVHTHNEKAQFYGALSGCLCRVPVVHTKHGKNAVSFRARVRNRLMASFCRKIVAVSDDASLQCVKEERIPSSKVRTILNGVDAARYAPADGAATRRLLGIPPATLVIGIVARLAQVKDHGTLFEACRLLKERRLPFRLLVVGDGPLGEELRRRARSLDLEQEIVFTGARQDVPALMNAMDLFVLSSLSEGISLTLIEAMASELPVVATRVGGNPEVVLEGETGLLVPARDAAAMADRILRLAQDEALRRSFGKKGRQRALERFSLQRAAREYEELYASVLGGTSHGS